jgi:P-type E1-E2 ATPase
LEALSQVRVFAFDKTGTLTVGRPKVLAYCASAGSVMSAEAGLRLAAGVEQQVSHPFARAIVEAVVARGDSVPSATDVRVTAGGGAQGCAQGHRVAVGKWSWLAGNGIERPSGSTVQCGLTVVGVAIDGRLAGELVVEDPLRSEALEALRTLRRMGLFCHLLSGDRREVVARVANSIDCMDFVGELSPTDKPRHVRALRKARGPVAMVGDGVNDAPALGAADVGIAFGPAADLAKETADITVLREDLLEIPWLVELARRTFRIVRQNLAWAFAYNVVAVGIAALGFLRPVYAAAAMVLSSVCVVHNSMRLNGTRP